MAPSPQAGGSRPLLSACAGLLSAGCMFAQTAPTPPTPPAPPTEPAVELSPFTVNTDKDLGYAAENTLAGSRLNSRLRDTAGSVSVFTKEFLDDLAITDLSRLLEYTVNSELDTNAWQPGSGQNPAISGENLLTRTIIRGLAASQGMDYFTSITNMDPYRVGRFDDTRGANSILFGVGAPGGLLNQTSKVAVTHRDVAAATRVAAVDKDTGHRPQDEAVEQRIASTRALNREPVDASLVDETGVCLLRGGSFIGVLGDHEDVSELPGAVECPPNDRGVVGVAK